MKFGEVSKKPFRGSPRNGYFIVEQQEKPRHTNN